MRWTHAWVTVRDSMQHAACCTLQTHAVRAKEHEFAAIPADVLLALRERRVQGVALPAISL